MKRKLRRSGALVRALQWRVKSSTNIKSCSIFTLIYCVELRNDALKRTAVCGYEILMRTHSYIGTPEWHHLVCLIWVWEHVCASMFLKCGLNCMVTHAIPTRIVSRILILMLFLLFLFFDLMQFYSSFCVCEDANVTHKVSIAKKYTLSGLFAAQLWYLLLSPRCFGFWSRNRNDMQMVIHCFLGGNLGNHSK